MRGRGGVEGRVGEIVLRAWDAERDFGAMRDLLVRVYALSGPPTYATVGDLEWWRATDDEVQDASRAHLAWGSDGTLLGFAWPSRGQVDVVALPGQPGVVAGLLAWAEERRRATADRSPVTLTAWAFRDDVAMQRLLRGRGYVGNAADDDLHIRVRALDGALPTVTLPEGYTLRPLQGAAECEARAAAHRDAFGSTRMTAAKHLAVLRTETYRSDLDLVVVAPDAELAAFTTIWLSAANRQGTFEPVGVRPAHQRRGLARALMCAGFERLRDHGATHASLTSDGGDVAAGRLYDSVGMLVAGELQGWTKTLAG